MPKKASGKKATADDAVLALVLDKSGSIGTSSR